MLNTTLRLVGTVGVDSGLLWLGDPAYVLHARPAVDIGRTWKGFVSKVMQRERQFDGVAPFVFDNQRAGLGLVLPTSAGDGVYKVYRVEDERGQQLGFFIPT